MRHSTPDLIVLIGIILASITFFISIMNVARTTEKIFIAIMLTGFIGIFLQRYLIEKKKEKETPQ